MDYAPEDELWLLMEAAESPFGLGEQRDFEYNAARPGNSPTLDILLALERQGFVEIRTQRDEADGRDIAVAETTRDGRKRMDELISEGVKPRELWLD